MRFVSYAQNFEDVMLWRALRHIPTGFYIDIGAQEPVVDSVSLAFYERGWRGIHVEPTAQYSSRLTQARPDETVLQVAIGSGLGSITIFEFKDTGLSTADKEIADQHKAAGFECVETQVPVLALDQLFDQNVTGPVHWLKIDVEGFERSVLDSWRTSPVRPWILVIESTRPLSEHTSHEDWEPTVLDKGYEFAYFDGLNRFYVSRDHLELKDAFSRPPNVFDDFALSGQASQPFYKLLEEKSAQQLATAEKKFASVQAALDAILSSRSWRVTAPMRWAVAKLHAARQKIKIMARQAVGWVASEAVRIPWVKVRIARVLRRFPAIEYRLRAALNAHRSRGYQRAPVVVAELADHEQRAPHLEDQIALPLPRGARILYVYVDHTANCPTNTGVQRVVRGLAAGLLAQGEQVRFVKWHPESQRCLLLNATEREHLALWNGPQVSEEERELYPPANQPQVPVASALAGENHWLIVPEVTHITFHAQPVTLELLLWAKRAGLKTGFVFYDAIPMRRAELHAMAPKHALYMQQLLLADMVWPISDWVGADLQAFWAASEKATPNTMPEVQTQTLSGESSLTKRVTQPLVGEQFILSVGSIEPRKNQVQLIRAFEAYRAKHPGAPWQLVLVGNLHPTVAEEVRRATQSDGAIRHLGHVSDAQLDQLYRQCAFTVFPSVEEGFGLPILESLWYSKPSICADFGSMAEVARGGGCLMVDTRDEVALENAISRLIKDEPLRAQLAAAAVQHSIKGWGEYAAGVLARVEAEGYPAARLSIVYYWIDATLEYPRNTGIQRVARQMARALLEIGVQLVPVKWAGSASAFGPVTRAELEHFARWNGPPADAWHEWVPPKADNDRSWFLMPELALNRTAPQRQMLLRAARARGLRCAAVFYDAIPWKMRRLYPAGFADAHRAYMLELAEYDLVLPISNFSRMDLVDFLGAELSRPQSLEHKVIAVPLAGEFPESTRVTKGPASHDGPLRVLCVGTVEPRKNHETLLRAFELAAQRSHGGLVLTLAGGSHSIEPELATRVRAFIETHPNISWEEDADDTRLRELHLQSDFTVYPSVEEGFGLPILESLWYARPCICANFGSMLEVAEGGGCLTVDVREAEALADALFRMANEPDLRERLVQESLGRRFKSWVDYGTQVALRLVAASPAPARDVMAQTPNDIAARATAMHLKPRPKLSVCISTYNRAEWLATSLRNWSRMCPQPLQGVELLVCDNASTDHTPEIVKPYLERRDFTYHRNQKNVGMLGNLQETAHQAQGEYVWILGDDDLLLPGAIERILHALDKNPGLALVYLNYAFTREEDARSITDFDAFFKSASPITPAEVDRAGPIRTICARNENFFTAIYTLVFRRDHALRAYSQDTSGRPFSSMPTCIPTTAYVLENMMEEPGLWIGSPQIVVNLNVSWLKYAPLWILERIPEVYEEAERHGVSPNDIDRWRAHTLPGVVHYFQEIYQHDPLNNSAYFSPERLVRRFKHLPEFAKVLPVLKNAYALAHSQGHPAAVRAPEKVFPKPDAI